MPARVAPIAGVGRFTEFNHFSSAVNDPVPGSTAMTRIFVLMVLEDLSDTAHAHVQDLVEAFVATEGWRLRWDGSNYSWQIADGAAGLRTASLAGTQLPETAVIVICTFDDASEGQVIRVNGVETIVGGSAGNGYTPSTGNPLTVGSPNNPTQDGFAVIAVLGSDSAALNLAARTAAEASIQDDLRQGRAISTAAGYDEFYWDARDFVGSIWTDRIGSLVLNEVGAVERFGFAARF